MSKKLLLAVFLQLVGVALFSLGFFPQGKAGVGTNDRTHTAHNGQHNDTCYEAAGQSKLPSHVILIVIDALRHEFISSMPSIGAMLQRGAAKEFRTHVRSPTVTLPRIKAIVSGTVSTFSDVVWNFASPRYNEDNWLTRARRKGKRVLFYGDDTWMKMFPSTGNPLEDTFEPRSEGVSSFFVTDYTEVDANVTRYLERELSKNGLATWDVMVLHFLGLDHIGHSLGGKHPQLRIKLAEMNMLVVEILNTLTRQKGDGEFVLFLTGDHGMTDAGGHGGNSAQETEVATVVFHSDLRSPTTATAMSATIRFEQIDLAPTLSALLGTSPPASNAGVSFLLFLPYSPLLKASSLSANARQFLSLMTTRLTNEDIAALQECTATLENFCSFPHLYHVSSNDATLTACHTLLKKVQATYLAQVDTFEWGYIVTGLAISVLASTLSLLALCEIGFTTQSVRELHNLVLILQHLLLFSSSYVEEEHDLWYFLFPLIAFHLLISQLQKVPANERGTKRIFGNKMLPSSILALMALHRFSRSHTEGLRRRWILFAEDKTTFDWAPDARRFFQIEQHWMMLVPAHMLTTMGLLSVSLPLFCLVIYVVAIHKWQSYIPVLISALCLCIVKSAEEVGDSLSSIMGAVQLCILWLLCTRNFSIAATIWILLLAKPQTYIIVTTSLLIGYAIGRLLLAGETLSCGSLQLLYCALASSFFHTGNSNSIASVDVAPGYVGISSYHPIPVSVQILLNTYSGPIAVFVGWSEAIGMRDRAHSAMFGGEALRFLLTMRSCSISTTMAALFFHRHHLFVQSVFSPKFIYEVAHLLIAVISLLLAELYNIFGYPEGSKYE